MGKRKKLYPKAENELDSLKQGKVNDIMYV